MLQARLLFILMISASIGRTQDFKHAGEYISYVSKTEANVSKKYLTYISEMSHGRNARKLERRRKEVIDACWESKSKVNDMPYWEGDKSLKQSSVAYFDLLYKVFNEDYAKIVDMEAIAEQSYDNMEAYMMAQDKAHEKLHDASDERDSIVKTFARQHNVNLIESKDEVSQKLEQAGEVNKYYSELYLIFFKSYKQENYLVSAMNENNVNNIEQNKNALLANATEGLSKLEALKPFKGDNGLINQCRKLLQFYKKEAEEKVPTIVDYHLKSEVFDKLKKEMDGKRSSSKEEVDKFNKAVKEINEASNKFNNTQKQMNTERENLVNAWNQGVQIFMDKHMPFYN